MGLNTDYAAMGMSPRPAAEHHDIIRSMIIELDNHGIFARSEYCIDTNDLNSQIPDVLLYDDQEDRYPAVIVEITTRKNFSHDCDKVAKLKEQYPDIVEGFVYDYESEEWVLIMDHKKYSESYSEHFGIDLSEMF